MLTACGAVQGVLPGGEEPTLPPPTQTLPPPIDTAVPATPTLAFGAQAATEEVVELVTATPEEPTPTRLAPLQDTPDADITGTPADATPDEETTPAGTVTPDGTATTEATADVEVIATPTQVPPPSGPVSYTVKAGDTLGEIAKAFGTTVDSIVSANSGTYSSLASNPNAIEVGWVLTLPDVVGSGTYTVRQADTLDTIATENNTTIEVLISLNEDVYPSLRTEPWKLEIGWVLRLP
jgi:LysM repeat protein